MSASRSHDGRAIRTFELSNGAGMRARLLDWGATLASLEVPDPRGRPGHVVLGFDDPDRYRGAHPHIGGVVGRCANRIRRGRFTLDGVEYALATNLGRHHLHGGDVGFDAVFWDAETAGEPREPGVRFRYHSADGEEGYPGALDVEVEYTLSARGELRIDYRATTDAPTIVNLTHHGYFNLDDAGAGDVLSHVLELRADRFARVDGEAIPTGELAEVAGTPLDFRSPRPLGDRIAEMHESGGYDHNFVLNDADLALAAVLTGPHSGRRMEVHTSEPGLQLYTSNFLDGSIVGRGGIPYRRHAAVCLEAQHFPDSANQPGFPSVVVRPGETYRQTTIYGFP